MDAETELFMRKISGDLDRLQAQVSQNFTMLEIIVNRLSGLSVEKIKALQEKP